MLDNTITSAKVARRHEKSLYRRRIVPNTFEGVNTYLWRGDAYVVGIVPVVRPAYSPQTRNGTGAGGNGFACWVHCFETKHSVLFQQKILNHEVEDRDISHTEEARCGTDRVGVADDRFSEKSQ